jgi:hypothetical protein
MEQPKGQQGYWTQHIRWDIGALELKGPPEEEGKTLPGKQKDPGVLCGKAVFGAHTQALEELALEGGPGSL